MFNISIAINTPPFTADMFVQKPGEKNLRFESMKGYFIFFGLKNGSDVLRSYQLMHRGKPVGNSLQTQGTITSFLMNLFLDKQSKENNGSCHSCWQNVMDDNGRWCGAKISYFDIWTKMLGGNPDGTMPSPTPTVKHLQLPLSVSFTLGMLPEFQVFRDYLNDFGELALKFYVNPDAFVWCPMDPAKTLPNYIRRRFPYEFRSDLGSTDVKKNTAQRELFDSMSVMQQTAALFWWDFTREFTQSRMQASIPFPAYISQDAGEQPKVALTDALQRAFHLGGYVKSLGNLPAEIAVAFLNLVDQTKDIAFSSTKPTATTNPLITTELDALLDKYIELGFTDPTSNAATTRKTAFKTALHTDEAGSQGATPVPAHDGLVTFILNIVKTHRLGGGAIYDGEIMLTLRAAFDAASITANQSITMATILGQALQTAVVSHLNQANTINVPISINSGRTYKGEVLWTNNTPINKIILHVDNISLTRVYCTTNGYRLNGAALDVEREKWSMQPFVFPGQTVDIISFSTGPTETGINTVIQYGFRSCTNIILLFPATSSQYTCYHNPHYKEVQITTLGQNYPDKAVQTIDDPQFAILQTIQNDFMFNEKNQEYADSMTMMRTDGEHLIQPLRDTTSFALTIKTERWSANGLIEDGLDTGGKNTSVRLNALPIYQNYNDNTHPKRDPFYGEKSENEQLHAPLMCCVQDIAIVFKMTPRGGECAWLVRNFEEGISAFMASGASSQ
jgi:hypothetical protein